MAGSLNMVQLIGNLGRDPEIRTTQSGGKVCTLSIATSESWKDKASGERKERTEWHRVVIWDEGLVDVADAIDGKDYDPFLGVVCDQADLQVSRFCIADIMGKA